MTRLFHVARREVRRLASHPIYWFCMLAAPLLCLVFFLTLMGSGLPTNLPLGLVDDDGSTTSRQLARNLDAFQQSDIVAQFPTVSEARKAMQRGEIYGFYYIPEGTSRKALRQEQATVSFYMNYSYLIAGSLVFRDMKTMSELASGAAVQQVMLARGATEAQAMALLQPIVVDTHPISNWSRSTPSVSRSRRARRASGSPRAASRSRSRWWASSCPRRWLSSCFGGLSTWCSTPGCVSPACAGCP